MGVFDDEKYEGLDWISQATEPIDSKLNEVLQLIPESVGVDLPLLKEIAHEWGMNIGLVQMVAFMSNKYARAYLSYSQLEILKDAFEMKVFPEGAKILIDFETNTMTGGEFKLVKTKSTMDESALKKSLGLEGITELHWVRMDNESIPRMNDILELLGRADEALKSKSLKNKWSFVRLRLKTIFANNEWNIRDTELANKISRWIKAYVVDGNLAAYSNFCRLKVMTHKELPIYSMQEVE